jgi:hypothetical protein
VIRAAPTLVLLLVACGSSLDGDGDGFDELSGDCDDANPYVFPGAQEFCNDADDDCDGETDEVGALGGESFHADADGDGWGIAGYDVDACSAPSGYADRKGDCHDGDPGIHPGADEVCDHIDNDCDDHVDEDSAVDAPTWYPDLDGDGFGDAEQPTPACEQPWDHVDGDEGVDCDDVDPNVNPAATETCETEYDDDCDGETNDPDAYDCDHWYADLDGDGYAGTARCLCESEGDYAYEGSSDCDDGDAAVNPNAVEQSNWVDDDCDGEADYALDDAFRMEGVDSGDYAGIFLAGGDVNGDGLADLLIGACYEDSGGGNSGAVYLVYGPATHAATLADADALLYGENASDYACLSAFAGDVNGDGLGDIMVAAVGHDAGGSSSGSAYIVLGPVTGQLDLAVDADIFLPGAAAGDYLGYGMDGLGDVNGDGVDDFAVGAFHHDGAASGAGAAWVFLGPVSQGSSLDGADVVLQHEAASYLGRSLAGAGDVNGDGIGDVVVGAPTSDSQATDDGIAMVFLGPMDSSVPQPEPDVVIHGETSYDALGYAVAGRSDMDGDGLDDLVLGAGNADFVHIDPGVVYVMAAPFDDDLVSAAGYRAKIVGEGDYDYAYRVTLPGDVDQDGWPDLVIGGPDNGGAGDGAGASWLGLGPVEGYLLAEELAVAFRGRNDGAHVGYTVAGPGDVDGDGAPDLLLGGYGDQDDEGAARGAAFLVYGGGG